MAVRARFIGKERMSAQRAPATRSIQTKTTIAFRNACLRLAMPRFTLRILLSLARLTDRGKTGSILAFEPKLIRKHREKERRRKPTGVRARKGMLCSEFALVEIRPCNASIICITLSHPETDMLPR